MVITFLYLEMSYSALLRLAEQFRQSNEIGCALQCLQAAADKTRNQYQAKVKLFYADLRKQKLAQI